MTARAAITAIVLLGPAGASADYRFAVLPLQPDASVTAAEAEHLRAVVARGLPSSMPLDEVDRRLGVTNPTRSSAKRLEEAARLLTAHLLLGGRVGKTGDAEWTVSFWMFDADQRATVATHRDQCGACSLDQAGTWALRVATDLVDSAGAPEASARVEVRSTPTGGAVSIDGSPVGVSGMTFGVAAGRHTVSVELEGYAGAVQEVDLAPGKTTVVALRLERTIASAPPGVPARGPGFLSARTFKWITLGAAVAGLAAGITLIALDGRGTCDESFPGMECAQVHDTMAAGAVLTALGGAAGVASGYLFFRDARDGRGNAAVVPTSLPGGLGLAAAWSY